MKAIGVRQIGSNSNQSLIAFMAIALGILWGLWSLYSFVAGGDPQTIGFNAAVGLFAVLALVYLGLHGLKDLAWSSVTVLLTIEAIVEYVMLPCWLFATGDEQLDALYVHAMFLTLMGFSAFWIGSLAFLRRPNLQFIPQSHATTGRVAFISAAMFIVGLSAKVVLWKLGLLSYLADPTVKDSTLPYISWLVLPGQLLNAALVVSAIERMGKRSTNPVIRVVFWLSLIFSILIGALSGMKSLFVVPVLIVVAIYSVTRRRIPGVVILLPVLLLIIYPFNTAYRTNLNNGYRSQVNTIRGFTAVVSKSLADVASSPLGLANDSNAGRSTARLSLLSYVHDIIGLPAPSLLNGDEKVWLAPFYPFIPRFIWKEKPVLDKGIRLSVALGRPDTTSTALTPIGDLYMLYGTIGVVVGMFMYGISLQVYMNWMCRRPLSERGIFVYLSLLWSLTFLEYDVVSLVAGAVQTAVAAAIVSYIIYGRPVHSLRMGKYSDPVRAI